MSKSLTPDRRKPPKCLGESAHDRSWADSTTATDADEVFGRDNGRRQILHVEVTDRPNALWLARQITEAFPWDAAPLHVIRDNDGAYGFEFRRRLKVMDIRDRPTRPRSPWQNGYVERLIARSGANASIT